MALIILPKHLAERSEFYYQLSAMIRAGLPLIKSLENLYLKPPARSYRKPIQGMLKDLNQGRSFAESLHRVGYWLPPFDTALLDAGERSGRLDECFNTLASYYDNSARLIRQIIGKLLYPIGLMHLAALIFPTDMLKTLVIDGDVTAFLLQKAGVFLPAYAIVLFGIVAYQSKRFAAWRSFVEAALSVVPLLGGARKALSMARLSSALEALINAGVGIIEAWELAAAASGSPAVNRAVMKWRPRIENGHESPGEILTTCPVFPETFVSLYRTGEISGQLDDSLLRLEKYYQEEGRRKLDSFSKVLVTFVVLGVMLAIAYFIISFYVGYFRNITDVIGE